MILLVVIFIEVEARWFGEKHWTLSASKYQSLICRAQTYHLVSRTN
jgi:hypothetical protein